MSYFKTDMQIMAEEAERKVYCPICHHPVVFLNRTTKIICSVCGRYIYNKNEIGQKQKFKDYLQAEMIKQKRKEREENAKTKKCIDGDSSN